MTPRRWLLLASGAALLYAGQMITAYLMGGTLLPVQLNTVIVTTVAAGFVSANSQDLAGKVGRQVESLTTVQASQIVEATELLRRLGHLEARMSTKVESLVDQTARFDQLWANLAAHMNRPDPAVLADHPQGYARGFAHGIARKLPLDEVDLELRRLTEDEP